MKRRLLGLVRSAGLLAPADRLLMASRRVLLHRRNRRFGRARPEFAYPPADLAFDAYGHVDKALYFNMGLSHARVFADIIRASAPDAPLAILEWGCGPARIIRHLGSCLCGYPVELSGVDFNPRTIAWDRENVPGVAFSVNGFLPPLPYPPDTFDVVYNFSVLSHLSAPVQQLWVEELRRVLKPGGLLICSTQGDYYRDRLASKDEAARYGRGEMVVQGRYGEGKKWFLALHPPRYVKEELLRDFVDVRAVVPPPGADMRQDLWTARKAPMRPEGAPFVSDAGNAVART
jgi:SAM-dependent methyltransferase